MDLFACSIWHSKADSASAAATPPVAEAAVSSTALSNAANSVGGYTAGTLGAIMHDCDKWVFTGQQALKPSTRVANGVEIGATKAPRRSRCPLMPPLKVHHYRGEPMGRDCTYNYKNHSTA